MVIYLLGEKLTLPQGVDCTIVVIVVEVYTKKFFIENSTWWCSYVAKY